MSDILWEKDVSYNESIVGIDIGVNIYLAILTRGSNVYIEAEVNGVGEKIQVTGNDKFSCDIPIPRIPAADLRVVVKDVHLNGTSLSATVEVEPIVDIGFRKVSGPTLSHQISV